MVGWYMSKQAVKDIYTKQVGKDENFMYPRGSSIFLFYALFFFLPWRPGGHWALRKGWERD
jgi:hypothetical protein